MKKIISFDKNLDFNSMIGDISSISFDHTLKFIDSSNIRGDFLIAGSYKLTEASRLEDKFKFIVPVEIVLNEVLDLDSTNIEIEDFNYHVENDDTLVCHIEIKVEGVEDVTVEEENIPKKTKELLQDSIPKIKGVEEKDELTLNRECDDEIKDNVVNGADEIKEIENSTDDILVEEADEVNDDISDITNNSVGSLFSSFKDSDETFSTYSVYIMRAEDNIEKIMEKYKITTEELENYNDLKSVGVGSKIIIPTTNERD